MKDELKKRKIQPRNLTARADRWVRGNPVTTRPESGVDNSYPGLEFDQRNLDKCFFPGLEFEYHLLDFPPIVRAVDDKKADRTLPIGNDDLGERFDEAIYLWAVFGKFGTMTGPTKRVEHFDNTTGLQAWRVVHDMEPGPAAVLLARRSGEARPALTAAEQLEAEKALQGGSDLVRRDQENRLIFAVLAGQRADYLVDGVVNPELYEPGDLTRSLCAPWQYDFTDCGCFYWASNKPDLVAIESNDPQLYNFQRRRNPAGERTPEEILKDRQGLLTISGWSSRDRDNPNRIMVYHELINNWEVLSPVFNAAEVSSFVPQTATQLPPQDVLSRAEIVRRLRYLATVEHALMVEYLYAYYSIDAPRILPDNDSQLSLRYDIARSVLSIAVDEMRHFRWVNEILRELGQPIELGRVDKFKDVDRDSRFIEHSFTLAPLTDTQLDWFIEVEKPSAEVDMDRASDTIDGLYTRLLLSIRQSDEFTDEERGKLAHLIKLIIDEGTNHWTRFANIKGMLRSSGSVVRAEYPTNPRPLPDGHVGKVAELAVDRAYSTVLSTLDLVFSASNGRTGDFLQAARLAMYALDDAAHEAILRGGVARFSWPEARPETELMGFAARAASSPESTLRDEITVPMRAATKDLRVSGSPETAASMERHYDRLVKEMMNLL